MEAQNHPPKKENSRNECDVERQGSESEEKTNEQAQKERRGVKFVEGLLHDQNIVKGAIASVISSAIIGPIVSYISSFFYGVIAAIFLFAAAASWIFWVKTGRWKKPLLYLTVASALLGCAVFYYWSKHQIRFDFYGTSIAFRSDREPSHGVRINEVIYLVANTSITNNSTSRLRLSSVVGCGVSYASDRYLGRAVRPVKDSAIFWFGRRDLMEPLDSGDWIQSKIADQALEPDQPMHGRLICMLPGSIPREALTAPHTVIAFLFKLSDGSNFRKQFTWDGPLVERRVLLDTPGIRIYSKPGEMEDPQSTLLGLAFGRLRELSVLERAEWELRTRLGIWP